MNEQQHTLARPAEVRGVGLFMGQPANVRMLPADADTGVLFVRTDLPGRPSVPLAPEFVPPPQRWTGVKNGDAEVRMIEHLLGALHGLEIDNLIVETDSSEMPAGDGSALTYVEPLLRAGLAAQSAPRRRMQLDRPAWVTDKDVALVAVPETGGLTLTYVLDYGQRFLRSQSATFTLSREVFIREIAPARTYVLRPEVDAFMKMGLGRGATRENTIVLEEDGAASCSMRFPDECARHKLLDMLGDLYLIGGAFHARVMGYKSGHATNVRLARCIRDARLRAGNP